MFGVFSHDACNTYPDRPEIKTLKWINRNSITHSHSLEWLPFKVPQCTHTHTKTSSVTFEIREKLSQVLTNRKNHRPWGRFPREPLVRVKSGLGTWITRKHLTENRSVRHKILISGSSSSEKKTQTGKQTIHWLVHWIVAWDSQYHFHYQNQMTLEGSHNRCIRG